MASKESVLNSSKDTRFISLSLSPSFSHKLSKIISRTSYPLPSFPKKIHSQLGNYVQN